MASKSSIFNSDDSNEEVMSPGKEKSQALYCRSSEYEKVLLEDLELISVIGKGSFGKVYLVYCPINK